MAVNQGENAAGPTSSVCLERSALPVGHAYCKIGQYSLRIKTELVDQSPDMERVEQIMSSSREQWGVALPNTQTSEVAGGAEPEDEPRERDPEPKQAHLSNPEDVF